ncbi:MAG: SPFH domain-containing protein [Cyanobacteriota bacterium]
MELFENIIFSPAGIFILIILLIILYAIFQLSKPKYYIGYKQAGVFLPKNKEPSDKSTTSEIIKCTAADNLYLIDLREQITTIRRGTISLENNLNLIVKGSIFYQINSHNTAFNTKNLREKIRNIAINYLKEIVQNIEPDKIITSRKAINSNIETLLKRKEEEVVEKIEKILHDDAENPYKFYEIGVQVKRIIIEDLDLEKKDENIAEIKQ